MERSTLNSYKDLVVWQKAMALVVEVYGLTERLPKTELYGLTSQLRRAAVSIPSNIAEGRRRGGAREFRQFLLTAYASGAEIETQIEICKRLSWGKGLNYTKVDDLLLQVMKMLNTMISKFSY